MAGRKRKIRAEFRKNRTTRTRRTDWTRQFGRDVSAHDDLRHLFHIDTGPTDLYIIPGNGWGRLNGHKLGRDDQRIGSFFGQLDWQVFIQFQGVCPVDGILDKMLASGDRFVGRLRTIIRPLLKDLGPHAHAGRVDQVGNVEPYSAGNLPPRPYFSR